MVRKVQLGGELIGLANLYNRQEGALYVAPFSNYLSDVSLDNVPGRKTVNKFGASPNGIQTTLTDIWSRADATPTQQIWLAPTAARVHALVSTSAADTGFYVQVYGLTSWDTAETSELVLMAGQTPANTANSYVIIHRMKMIPTAAKTLNAGTITATAADDGTITAVINYSALASAGDGQTEMAIYGVPSTQRLLIHNWFVSLDKAAGAAVSVNWRISVNPNPNVQTTGFLRKMDASTQSTGVSALDLPFTPPLRYDGPCIIKVQAYGSAADISGFSSFDAELVTI
jgi:hypothetical protein